MTQSETIIRLFEKIDEQIKILHEVDKKVTSLDERMSGYHERLRHLETSNEDLFKRVEKLENNFSVIQCKCNYQQEKLTKINELELDMDNLKRDYKWVQKISDFIRWII